jgi:predicted CopG family antitoxin
MKSISSKKSRQIVISPENYEKLKTWGKFNQSFDDVVTELLRRMEQ